MVPKANPQLAEFWKQNVPDASGRVKVLFWVNVARSIVPKKEEVLSPKTTSPVLATLNRVVPEALAAIRSPEFVLFTMKAALLPIPPKTERGASVFAEEPIKTPELKSEERIVLPEPFGVRVRLLLLPDVEMVVPVIERLFVPKSSVPTFVIFWALAESKPPKVKALICSVPVDEMMFVPPSVKEISAFAPVRVRPDVP